MMTEAVIVYPAFVQVLLTFALCLWMGKLRFAQVGAGTVQLDEIQKRTAKWEDKTVRVELAFYNQFQVPILFYGACAFAAIFHQVDMAMVVLAWVFVGSRTFQIFSHTVSNNSRLRFLSFLVGILAVLGMWGYLVFILST
ncbi:MAG: MAPEG family protein [Sneathiella sp.]|nr:MAPEG family protein [Sneathiella sp.]